MPRSADRRRARTRDEILAAAWTLCRTKGLAGLSLRELAAAVGMRAPSLYSYFGSKDDIYDAMFAQGQRELLAALTALTPAATAEPDDAEAYRRTLLEGSQLFFDFCTADPLRYQLMFQRVIAGFTPSAESYALALEVIDHLDRHLAAAGVHDPGARDLWTALVTGLTDQQISNDPGGDRWARLLPAAVEMFCAQLTFTADAPEPGGEAPATRRQS